VGEHFTVAISGGSKGAPFFSQLLSWPLLDDHANVQRLLCIALHHFSSGMFMGKEIPLLCSPSLLCA